MLEEFRNNTIFFKNFYKNLTKWGENEKTHCFRKTNKNI
jgi:hypothetical protein